MARHIDVVFYAACGGYGINGAYKTRQIVMTNMRSNSPYADLYPSGQRKNVLWSQFRNISLIFTISATGRSFIFLRVPQQLLSTSRLLASRITTTADNSPAKNTISLTKTANSYGVTSQPPTALIFSVLQNANKLLRASPS
jgi:hypothetical protein